MPWIRPTGFEDPDDKWEDEANAFDGNVETFATSRDVAVKTASSHLILTFPRGITFAVRFYVSASNGETRCLQSYCDGSDCTFFTNFNFVGVSSWVHWDIGERWVNRVHVYFWPIGSDASEVHIHGCEILVACSGPLVDLCGFLRQVGTFLIDLSLDIAELWLIGGFLATYVEILGEQFLVGAEFCCSASSTLQAVLDVVAEGVTADALLALILNNWPTLYYLITDPVGWFLVQLTLAFGLEPWHTQSLEFLAKYILETYFPALYAIWLDLDEGFLGLLEKRSPILYYLVVDPEGEIRYLIGQWFNLEPFQVGNWALIFKALMERFFPILWALYLDPEAWLAKFVDPRLLAVPEAIAAFLDDPWGWLFDRLEDRTDMYADRIGTITLEIIARLLGV